MTAAPSQTSFQAILISGKNLKIMANKSVITRKETIKLISPSQKSAIGQRLLIYSPRALTAALRTSEASKRNPMPSTIVKDRMRLITNRLTPSTQPFAGFGFTSQMVLSEFCNSPNTPSAPNSNVTAPMNVAVSPVSGRLALSIIPSMNSRPSTPSRSSTCAMVWVWAASCPPARPAMAMTNTRRGASEKVV